MITVFHRGDAPQVLDTLQQLGIAHFQYDLRRGIPEVTWAAGQHLREIGRTRDLGGGVYELLTPTTTVDNALGRSIIAGDYPETVLAKLPPLDRSAPIHERREDGRCSCKTDAGAQVFAEVNVAEPQTIGGIPVVETDRVPPGTVNIVAAPAGSITVDVQPGDEPGTFKLTAKLAPVCPECRAGKHRNCDGVALDEATDEIVECTCPPAFGHEPRQGRGR